MNFLPPFHRFTALLSFFTLPLAVQAQEPRNPLPFNLRNFPYIDVHVHSSLKPFNSRNVNQYSIWQEFDHDCDGELAKMFVNGTKAVPKTTQSHFESLVRGNVRVAYLSLVPLEKEMLHLRFINERKKGTATFACVTGAAFDSIVSHKTTMHYYNDLVANIRYVEAGAQKPYIIDGQEYTYELIQTADQLRRLLSNPHRLGIVLNIEGGHALGVSLEEQDISHTEAYEQFYLANVDRIKGIKPLVDGVAQRLVYPILSLNLNHFFWNGLSGQARTFSNFKNIVFQQNKGVDAGITPLGEKVVKRLLDKNNGRRILLDVKHMSLATRQWYYNYLDTLRQQGDTVAILSSHSSIAGLSWSDKKFLQNDNNAKLNNSYFHNWTLNLANEDILQIHQSKGLIGLILDKYRLMGDLTKKIVDATVEGSAQRRQAYAKVICLNIFACVQVVNLPTAWDIIAIGSDFDGMITPFETYTTSAEMPDLARDVYNFLQNPSDIFGVISQTEVERLMFGYTPERLIEKIMYTNALEFTLRNLPKK